MSLMDKDRWGDADEFEEEFGGDAPSLEQIRALQVGGWGAFAVVCCACCVCVRLRAVSLRASET